MFVLEIKIFFIVSLCINFLRDSPLFQIILYTSLGIVYLKQKYYVGLSRLCQRQPFLAIAHGKKILNSFQPMTP